MICLDRATAFFKRTLRLLPVERLVPHARCNMRSRYPAHGAGITVAAGRRAGLLWLVLDVSAVSRPRAFSNASSGFADHCRPAGAQGLANTPFAA